MGRTPMVPGSQNLSTKSQIRPCSASAEGRQAWRSGVPIGMTTMIDTATSLRFADSTLSIIHITGGDTYACSSANLETSQSVVRIRASIRREITPCWNTTRCSGALVIYNPHGKDPRKHTSFIGAGTGLAANEIYTIMTRFTVNLCAAGFVLTDAG